MTTGHATADVLLIFDMDGTLYRTESSFLPAIRGIYARYDVEYPGDEILLKAVGEPCGWLLDWMASEGFPQDLPILTPEITQAEYDSAQEHGELYPDVEETLRSLKLAGHRLAICTNGGAAYVDVILGKFGFGSLFDAIKTYAEDGRSKVEMVAELLDRFHPSRAYIIGDRYHDFEAGRANGCTVVAVTYGFADDWKTADIDLRLDRFSDLPRLVEATQ